MARSHGKETVIIIDGNDISQYCDTSELEQGADEHDVTTYGNDDHVVDYGLGMGSMTMGGVYDTTAAGPKAVLEGILDGKALVTLVRRVEGTGSGRPQESMSVLVKSYKETAPVADYVRWTCEMTKSGSITRTTQA